MAEKKQFFKEEVQAYSDLFSKHSVKIPGRLNGKDGVPFEVAAKLLEENTAISFSDQVLLLLKAYGQQLPSRFVLSGVTSAGDISRNENQVRHELHSGSLEISLTKTNFMYLCQCTAIFQSPEMEGKSFSQLLDIKKFKSHFKKVPLVQFSPQPVSNKSPTIADSML